MSTNQRQKLLRFDGEKEARRLERVERLLGRLGQPPETITTGAKMFDYAEASKVAEADNKRATRLAANATLHPKANKKDQMRNIAEDGDCGACTPTPLGSFQGAPPVGISR